MLDRPTLGCDQEIGDDLTMALRKALLGTEQAEWCGQSLEPAHQQVAGALEKSEVGRTPILEVAEQVAKLQDGVIRNPAVAEQPFDALVSRPRLDVSPHARPFWANPDVGDRPDPVPDQETGELIGHT